MNYVSSPKYIIDFTKFRENCEKVMRSFDREWCGNTVYGYSVKTNRNEELIKYAYHQLGWFVEIVSPDEYRYCTGIGISGDRIVFNGPCKETMIHSCSDVGYINLDNLDEVRALCRWGNRLAKIGLRVNFDLEKVCPTETIAGENVSRFGIDSESEDLDEAIKLLFESGIREFGIHLHTSTITRSLGVFKALARKAVELRYRYDIVFPFVDIGGGFFGGQKVMGKPTMEEYSKVICNELKIGFDPAQTTLILEPGASVLATCASYETKVINVRDIRGVRVVTLDGTLLHINPFMARRNQPFDIKNETADREIIKKQIVCGSTCMENDRFAYLLDREGIKKGDVLTFYNVGAYTMAFNSFFILNPPRIEYIGG